MVLVWASAALADEPVAEPGTTAAEPAERRAPSKGLRVVTGAGLVTGVVGGGMTAFGLSFAASPEPIGLIVFYPPGAVFLGVGTTLALGGSLAQAQRVGAPDTAGLAGIGLALGGAAAFTTGVLGASSTTGDASEVFTWTALAGGPALVLAGLVTGGAQGVVNERTAEGSSVRAALLPDPRGRGLVLAGTF